MSTLDQLRAAVDAVADLPVVDLPDALGVLVAGAARAQLRLAMPAMRSTAPTTNLTAEQVASALNVRPSAVYEWHRAKRIPGERYGRFLRFDLDAVRRALAEDSKTVCFGSGRHTKKARHTKHLRGSFAPLTTGLPPGGPWSCGAAPRRGELTMSGKSMHNQGTTPALGVNITQATQGVPIAVIYGRCRVPGNVIWLGTAPYGFANLPDVTAEGTTVAIEGGFGGASGPTDPRANYFCSGLWALCEGPIVGVRTLYKRELRYVLNQAVDPTLQNPGQPPGPLNPLKNPDLIENFAVQQPDGTVLVSNMALAAPRIFRGAPGQPPWTDDFHGSLSGGNGRNMTTWTIDFRHPTPALNYPYLAYVARHAWPLYASPDLPNLNVEVFGLCAPDVRPGGAA